MGSIDILLKLCKGLKVSECSYAVLSIACSTSPEWIFK